MQWHQLEENLREGGKGQAFQSNETAFNNFIIILIIFTLLEAGMEICKYKSM